MAANEEPQIKIENKASEKALAFKKSPPSKSNRQLSLYAYFGIMSSTSLNMQKIGE